MGFRTANIIGSGPNGLTAAITLAERGVAVTVYERNAWAGGACATRELTLPGFRHDVGSSVYPLGVCSPAFSRMGLEQFGLRWMEPEAPLAHPLDDGPAVVLEHAIDAMVAQLGERDGVAWRRLMGSTVRDWRAVVEGSMAPLLRVPRDPMAMATFGMAAMMPASLLARMVFQGERARALLGGCAAHSVVPLTKVASSAAGLVLAAAAHTTGWPIAAGGAQSIADALVKKLESLGGRVELGVEVRSLNELPAADVTMFDTTVSAMEAIAGDALSASYVRRLKSFKRGPGVFKVDWALREAIPWRDAACRRAATVHVGGTLEEIAASEHAMFYGKQCERPFVLLVQPSLFDDSRAPEGRHTAWGYCHVPADDERDWTDVIEAQVERFASGFRDCVMARKSWGARELEAWNPNLRGGDVSGGAMTLGGLLARPTLKGYRTNSDAMYLCSASTPPGGGVHGMCGYGAAMAAVKDREQG